MEALVDCGSRGAKHVGWLTMLAIACALLQFPPRLAKAQQAAPKPWAPATPQSTPAPTIAPKPWRRTARRQPSASPATDMQRRLQRAEARIGELEARLSAASSETTPAESKKTPDAEKKDAEEKTTSADDKLRTLEKNLAKVQADLGKYVLPGHGGGTMKVAGRINIDYWGFPGSTPGVNAIETGDPNVSPQDRIFFRRLRFGVAGNVKENMVYKIDMEFAGGNNPQFRDAYFGFDELPLLQTVLLGNQKRPYGLDALNSSRYNVFMTRPFVIDATNHNYRRFGLQSYGISEDLAYNWRYGAFFLNDFQGTGGYVSDHYQMEAAGRFANTIWYDKASGGRGYAHWAVSGTVAHPDGSAGRGPVAAGLGRAANEARFRTQPEIRTTTSWLNTGRIAGADWYQLLGLEAVFNVGAVQFVTEYQSVWLQRAAAFGPDVRFDGAYCYVSYFLTGEHMPWDRASGTLGRPKPFEYFFLVNRCNGKTGGGWGAWQVACRLSQANFNSQDILGGRGAAVTLGMNWYWSPYARMQFNYVHGRITNRGAGIPAVLGPPLSGNYDGIGARFMIDF